MPGLHPPSFKSPPLPPAGYTPMHLAVLCGNVQTMKLLHAAGADINAAVSSGRGLRKWLCWLVTMVI